MFSKVILMTFLLNKFVGGTCPYLKSLNIEGENHNLRSQKQLTSAVESEPGPLVFPTTKDVCDSYILTSALFRERIPTELRELSEILGKIVRLTWHDAGEYDQTTKDKFGPDGCLSTSSMNAGLIESDSLVNTFIEPIYQELKGKISRADFWTLLGKIALEEADPTHELKIDFHYGRKDNIKCNKVDARLPSAQLGRSEIRRVFVKQLGLSMSDAVTLLGAHTLGHFHKEFSGYGLPFIVNNTDLTYNAFGNTPHIFDNDYILTSIAKIWINIKIDEDKNFWGIPGSNIIFLNADMAIGFPIDISGGNQSGVEGQICNLGLQNSVFGCSKDSENVERINFPQTMKQQYRYAANNSAFLADFSIAYSKMMTRGFGVQSVFPGNLSTGGKLGKLTTIDLEACRF